MKILEVVHGFPPELRSGTDRVVLSLSQALKARGHDVVVLSGARAVRPKVSVERSVYEGVQVIRVYRDDLYHALWWKTWHPAVSGVIGEILRSERPDVVHVHHWIHLSRDIVRTAARLGIPAVVSLHDLSMTCPLGFRAPGDGTVFCERRFSPEECLPCAAKNTAVPMPEGPEALRSFRSDFQNELRLAARVLVLSAAQRAILCRELGLAGDDFVVVPLGLAGDIVRPESPGPPPPLRAIVFGVHVPAKGTHVALEALRSAGKGVAIDVVGPIDKEGYGERLRGLAEGLDVTFHGRYELPDLARFRAHVAILPSLYFETYGLTLDEAHALGLPAIVTDRGALRERMSPADLAFPPGDATTLSRHLVRLRDSSAELLRLRAAVPKPRPFDDSVLAIEAACGDAVAGGPPDLSLDQFDSIPHLTPEGFAEREARFRWLAGKG